MTTATHTESSILRPLLGIGATILILAGMWAGASVVNLVLMAGLLTLLCVPLLHWLRAKGLSSWLAITLIILGVLLGAVLIIGLIGISAAQVVAKIPEYEQALADNSDEIARALQARGLDPAAFASTLHSVAGWLFGLIAGVAGNLAGLLVNGAFVLLIFGYMLADSDNLGARLRRFVPADSPLYVSARASTSSVGTYMLILTAINFTIAVLDVIFLTFLGIPHALLWGVLAFVFGYVPYIGYWVSILPPLILGFIQGGLVGALIIILGYWFINGMLSTVVAPRFFGQGLNLSPVLALVAVLFWGALLGPVGSIVGVPMTAMIKSIVLDNYSGTRWLAGAISAGDGTTTSEGNQPS